MNHLSNWIEIPATNLDRAKQFYSTILGGLSFHDMEMQDTRYALFPSEDRYNCGALVQGPHHRPSADGVTVYLDGGADMDPILARVESAGGQVLMPRTYTGSDAGHVGMFLDSEGNKIGLQTP